MADTNYMPKVYLKRGSDEQVVADGGQVTVESGGEIEIESGGTISVESGGSIAGGSGGVFTFYGTDFTADKLQNFFLSHQTTTQYISAGTIFDSANILPAYGYHRFYASTDLSLASITLPTPDSGCILYLDGAHMSGDANLSVTVSGTTITLINQNSTALSSFEISALGYAKLICIRASEWAIVESNITEKVLA